MKARAVLAVLMLVAAAAYGLWRIDVLPGWWDLTHWGLDVEEVAERARAAHRADRLRVFEQEAAAARMHAFDERAAGGALATGDARPTVVFIGSSTIERFDLEAAFPGASTWNRGIGDERAELMAARLDAGIDWALVDGVVVYAASVDFRRVGVGAEATVRRAELVLDGIAARAAGKPVLVLGLLSQRDLVDDRTAEGPTARVGRRSLDAANAALAAAAAERGFGFLPLDRAPLTAPDGTLAEAYAADRLHLNRDGYQVLTEWIRKNGGPLAALLFP